MTGLYLELWLMASAAALLSLPCVHAWQLEAYKPPQYMRWLRSDLKRTGRGLAMAWARGAGGAAAWVLAAAAADGLGIIRVPALFILLPVIVMTLLGSGGELYRFLRAPHKKALVFTARIRRLLAAQAALAAAWAALMLPPAYALIRVLPQTAAWGREAAAVLFYTATAALGPLLVVLAGILTDPVERRIQRWYYHDAQKRLAGWRDMIKVGITGSYGKTSAKVILGAILEQRFRTLVTPHSYNTPMGVARTVRERMSGREEVFVAEMGARNRGDIAEMCDLVAPRYGLLTSVGPQHLETFGSLENVARTKYELVESLPEDGWAFFSSDNEICLALYRRTAGNKLLFGLDGRGEPLYMTAREVETTSEGSIFTLCDAEGGQVRCKTRLLGRHNIINILGCAAVARKLGMTLPEIAAGIRMAQPVEHRLQLLETGNGVTVIDDAFNASPDGTRAALEVLKSFSGRKIIVTPGLVELGAAEERENEIFGGNMAGAADVAILVSRNGAAMERGLAGAGFAGQIVRAGNLEQATRALSGLTRAGDVVLFENDLPDHYEQ